MDSFELDDDQITMDVRVETPDLDVDSAIPLGLIINELITNSLKYAFPDSKTGKITLTLRIDEAQKLVLLVGDNGVGKTGKTMIEEGTHFGQKMVQILSKKLKGNIQEKGQQKATKLKLSLSDSSWLILRGCQ